MKPFMNEEFMIKFITNFNAKDLTYTKLEIFMEELYKYLLKIDK